MIDCLVIGAGPAGLAAGLAAKEEGASTLVLERLDEAGGILMQCIHHGFGLQYLKEELTGPEYAWHFSQKAKKVGLDLRLNTMVLALEKFETAAELYYQVTVASARGIEEIKTRTIVLAMGCRERTAAGISLLGTRPAGVYTAGMAQYLVNRQNLQIGKKIVIYGSGDIGLIMARRMSLEGAKVEAVIEVNSDSSGLSRNIVQCLDDYNIPLMLSTKITKIMGKERIEAVELCLPSGEKQVLACDCLLLSVGLIPENDLSLDLNLELSPLTKGPIVNQDLMCSSPGIFACGNVLHVHDIVDFVTAEASQAGKMAARFQPEIRKKIKVHSGARIHYTLPFYLDRLGEHSFSLRAQANFQRQNLLVYQGGSLVFKKRLRAVRPAEMIRFKFKLESLDQDLRLELEDEEGKR